MTEATQWRWSTLATRSGTAVAVTDLVRDLFSVDHDRRENAFGTLHVRVANQGSPYPAAAGVTDLLLAELESAGRLSTQAWYLLQLVFDGYAPSTTAQTAAGAVDIRAYVRPRVSAALPLIEDAPADMPPDEISSASWLLMSLAEESFEVVRMLERELAESSTPRRDALALALKDARESWDEAQQA